MLVIDTAGPVVGVARLGGFVETARVGHGADRVLTPWIARAIVPPPTLIAVTVGPGAFTGIRVGLAHALGVALALGVEVVPMSSMAVRALACPGVPCVTVLLDAKKGRVWMARFDMRGPVPVALGPEVDIAPEDVSGGGPAVGEGAHVHRVLLTARGFTVQGDADALPLEAVGPMVAASPRMDAAKVAPRYLMEPSARPLQ